MERQARNPGYTGAEDGGWGGGTPFFLCIGVLKPTQFVYPIAIAVPWKQHAVTDRFNKSAQYNTFIK